MPSSEEVNKSGKVLRVNDGNDSNVKRHDVIAMTEAYERKFFNTSIPKLDFPGPVVLTVNPGKMTDEDFHKVDPIPENLMFVRVRTNTWNWNVSLPAIEYYTKRDVPVVLTFMAYFHTIDKIPEEHRKNYEERKRTTNTYTAISNSAWKKIMDKFVNNPLVHSCGTEGVKGGTACRHCGTCLREYFATQQRLQGTMRTVVCVRWTESERGWGQRPDGVSLHLTTEQAHEYIVKYEKSLPDAVPHEYSFASHNRIPINVSEGLYEKVKAASKNKGLRFWQGETPKEVRKELEAHPERP